jgi:cytochrome c biogenesis protein CcmG/thiol:disulfide interchange protein DsbE
MSGPESSVGGGAVPDGPPRRPGSRRRMVALTLAPIVVFVSLLASGFGRDPRTVPDVVVGRPAPAFDLQELGSDRHVRLADLRGQVVVLNFWASWCAACVVEQGSLDAAWRRFADSGVVFLAPVFQDTASGAEGYAATYGVGWPILLDPGSRVAIGYGVSGVPETVIVGPDGSIAFKEAGPVSYDVLARWIERLLPAPGQPGQATPP